MRAEQPLLRDVLVYARHLFEVELAGEHHHVGPLRIVAHRLAVAHVHLRGDVYLHPYAAGIEDGGHVAGDDGADAGIACCIDDAVHVVDVLVIDDSVHGEVGLDASLGAPLGYGVQVVDREIHARLGAHVKVLDAKIDGIGTTLLRRHQALPRPHGSH